MAYIRKHSDKTPCFICAGLKSKKDESTLIVHRGATCIAMLNRFPYANGHVMVAPKAHKASLDKLTDDERLEMLSLAAAMQGAIDGAFRPDGYNLGMNLGRVAGAGLLGHVHLHVVPRWNGDTNFMPVTAGTKVHPMSLGESWRLLRKHLKKTTV